MSFYAVGTTAGTPLRQRVVELGTERRTVGSLTVAAKPHRLLPYFQPGLDSSLVQGPKSHMVTRQG